MKRGILTIAYGPRNYLRMVKGLARSVRFHNPAATLALVTDSNDPELRVLFDSLIPLDASLGTGVMQKLYVDQYTPYDQTLFIDSDCLAFASTELLWPMYQEAKGVGIKGWAYLGADDQHYAIEDMKKLLALCGVEQLGAFNSGLFYFDRSPAARQVFETARDLSRRGQELGLKAFKNSPCADEPILALALELNAISMLAWDDGRAMCTATADDLRGLEDINVLTGQRRLLRYGALTEPLILHFHMQAQNSFPYLRELFRLQLGTRYGRGILPQVCVMPAYAQARMRYLSRRVKQRVRQRGLAGLVPERIELAWKRRSRSAADPAP